MIEKGALLDASRSFDGKPVMNWVVAAPVSLDGVRHLMFVRIRKNEADPSSAARFYVHEVLLESHVENEEASPFKSGSDPDVFRGKKSGGTGFYLSLARRALAVNPDSVSKVVDENGEPLVVYHGTPTGGFDTFKSRPTYFHEVEHEADVYQSSAASSIRASAEQGGTPTTYGVFLNVRNPFDTRTPAHRKEFQNEFFEKGGEEWSSNGTELTERGLPDWTDGRDLADWIEETGKPYDAVRLDEGSLPQMNGSVRWRGASWMIPQPGGQNIKSATANNGDFDPANPSILASAPANRSGRDLANLTPAKAQGPFAPDNITRAYRAVQGGSSSVMVPIRAVFQRMKAAHPEITPAQFMQAINAANDGGGLMIGLSETQSAVDAAGPFRVGVAGTEMALAEPQKQFRGAVVREARTPAAAPVFRAGQTPATQPGQPDETGTIPAQTGHQNDDQSELEGQSLYSAPAGMWGALASPDFRLRGGWHPLFEYRIPSNGSFDALKRSYELEDIHEEEDDEGGRIVMTAREEDGGGTLEIRKANTDAPYLAYPDANGGGNMIQAGLSWAYFNDKTLVPDPDGSSDINLLRYTSHMASNALKHRSATHFTPFAEQGIDWQEDQSFEERLNALTTREMEQVFAAAPDLKKEWKIDLKKGMLKHDGRTQSSAELYSWLEQRRTFAHGVGVTTATRALLTARAMGRAGEIYDGATVQELHRSASRLLSGLESEHGATLYSAPAQPDKQAQAREILESMPPIWREVLQDQWAGKSIEDIATARNLSLVAVGNILRMAGGRFQILMDRALALDVAHHLRHRNALAARSAACARDPASDAPPPPGILSAP